MSKNNDNSKTSLALVLQFPTRHNSNWLEILALVFVLSIWAGLLIATFNTFGDVQ